MVDLQLTITDIEEGTSINEILSRVRAQLPVLDFLTKKGKIKYLKMGDWSRTEKEEESYMDISHICYAGIDELKAGDKSVMDGAIYNVYKVDHLLSILRQFKLNKLETIRIGMKSEAPCELQTTWTEKNIHFYVAPRVESDPDWDDD